MRRAIATDPTAKMARITATARNAAGMPVSPVVWYAVGITPAATVSGARPASTKNSAALTPSRSLAKARDRLAGLVLGSGTLDIRYLQVKVCEAVGYLRWGSSALSPAA